MAAEHLAARTRQPGHDRSFTVSEDEFVAAAAAVLPACAAVRAQPRDLIDLFRPAGPGVRPLGVVPEAVIEHTCTGRVVYVEVKKQGEAGNAEERAAKHHTVAFYRHLAARLEVDYHAYVTVFCDALATQGRYTDKYAFLYEPGHWLAWREYDRDLLREFLMRFWRKHLGTCPA